MNNIFNHTYKNKKVFVTGHTGFKGTWLSLWLTLLGAEVAGFALEPNTKPSLFDVLKLENHLISNIGDIRDKDSLGKAIKAHKPDFIFHLAAQPLVRYSYQQPLLTFETNVMGTANLLEILRKTNFEGVAVNITSDKCYENIASDEESDKHKIIKTKSFVETDPMGGYDPYSASKGAAEIVTAAYRNSFFNPRNYGVSHKAAIASARAGNVIGGGDWSEDRLIPDIIRALSENKEIIIRNPDAIRPWQHVIECVSGYLHLGMMLNQNPAKYSQGWNFGPEEHNTRNVEQILLKSLEVWGSGSYKIIPEKILKEAAFLRLDITKAMQILEWQPAYNIDLSVEKTVEWYKNYYAGNENMFEYTKNQIEEYVCKCLINFSEI